MATLVVTLHDHIGTGLIIPWSTGIEYVQQAGGTSCLQLRCEGVFVPFGSDLALHPPELLGPEPDLNAYFAGPVHRGTGATQGLTEQDANVLDSILARFPAFTGIRVHRGRLRESCEAWVHVELDSNAEALWDVMQGFNPTPGTAILIWANSD
jgi:hypothetical protein